MATYGSDWDIKGSSGACAVTEKKFDDGEAIYSRILHGEDGFVREDFCLDSWSKDLKDGAISHWKSVYRAPVKIEKIEVFGLEMAERMLREMLEGQVPSDPHTMYVLALMLERKRLLVEKEVQTEDEGERIRVYEHKRTGDVFVIPDPDLNLKEMSEIQLSVAKAIGWRPPQDETEGEKAAPAADGTPAAADVPAEPAASSEEEGEDPAPLKEEPQDASQ